MSGSDFIILGKLGRTRGVWGEIYITPDTDFPERFVDLTEIYVMVRSNWEKRKLDSAKLISGRPVLKFEGVNNREDAARMTNLTLGVPMEEAVELPDDTFYIFDLIGCKVFAEDDERLLGEIIDVEQYPANDVYTIKMVDGRSVSIPAARKYVKNIDITKRRITVAHVDQLEQ